MNEQMTMQDLEKISTKMVLITPEMASEWLTHDHPNNRGMIHQRVALYAKSMKNGDWQLNGEGIRFTEDGTLVDGQHRLAAVVKAGVSVYMNVTTGLPNGTVYFDQGANRTDAQILRFGGTDKLLANYNICGTAKLYISLTRSNNCSTHMKVDVLEIERFIQANENALRKIYAMTKQKGTQSISTRNAPLMTALFVALKAGETEEKLAKFAQIIHTGFYDNVKEKAAIVCRNDMTSNPKVIDVSGRVYRIKAVKQFEKAIFDFCRGRERVRSYAGIDEHTYFVSANKAVKDDDV